MCLCSETETANGYVTYYFSSLTHVVYGMVFPKAGQSEISWSLATCSQCELLIIACLQLFT